MNRSEALIILDLKDGMNLKEISAQRNFLLQCFHPDKHNNPEAKNKAEAKTKKILEAYEYLKNNVNNEIHRDRRSEIKTVKDFCNLDEGKFFSLSCKKRDNQYVESSYNFYCRVRLWDYNKLSKRQQEWLAKICIMVYEYNDN